MKMLKALRKVVENAKLTDAYWVEKAKLNFALALEGRRKGAAMSYKQIAEKIGTSQPYVTKVFRGDANFTIETMVKLARATGATLDIQLVDTDRQTAPWHLDRKQTEARRGQALVTGGGEVVIEVDFAANQSRWFTSQGAAERERVAA